MKRNTKILATATVIALLAIPLAQSSDRSADNMKIEGLDHVAIGVKDMDKAVEWFTRVLGTEFYDIAGSSDLSSGELGARYMLSFDHGLVG